MSELQTIIPSLILEEVRCSICEGYLSCSPLCVLQDGNCICGKCSTTYSNPVVYRVLPLEAILRRTSFPCQFEKYGCTEHVLFGKVADHQHICQYRSLPCPLLTFCSWEGPLSKLCEHFTEQHTGLVKDNAEFKFDLDQNSEEVFMTVEDSFFFIIKYIYRAKEVTLKYDVRVCTNKIGYDVSFKTLLINAVETECLVSLKTNKCPLYNEGSYEMHGANILDINKFLHSLGNPNSITVATTLKVVKFGNDSGINENKLEVNFDLLNSRQCNECKNCDCAKDKSNCTLFNYANLLKHVNKVVYSCRWRDCDFVASSNNNDIKNHERICQFRLYKCILNSCGDTFKLTTLTNHVQEYHKILYFDHISYKISFSQGYYPKYMFTIKQSTLILLVHEMVIRNSSSTHTLRVTSSYGDAVKISTIVNFEHENCKCESKKFMVDKEQKLNVTLKQLPRCVKKKDVLTVTTKFDIL